MLTKIGLGYLNCEVRFDICEQNEKSRVSKLLLKISQLIGLVFFVLLGTITASSSAMAHMATDHYVSSGAVTSKTMDVVEATSLQTNNESTGQTDGKCKSCSASCPPTTCMTGIIAYPGNFVAGSGYSYPVLIASLQTNYASLAADFFHPPRR